MGLSWQQGPLAPDTQQVPELLALELAPAPAVRRAAPPAECGVRSGDSWIADSEDVVPLHEPGRYPVADLLPLGDIADGLRLECNGLGYLARA